jgi:hypothetical protein
MMQEDEMAEDLWTEEAASNREAEHSEVKGHQK